MKIITYNVLDGFENADHRKKACALWLKSQNPDIVFLNELNHFTAESLSLFAKEWNHTYSILLSGRSSYKIGITSNLPLTDVETYYQDLLGHGVIICKRKNLTLINTHLNPHSIKKRHHDLDFILSKLEPLIKNNLDVIFGGDLNSLFIGEKEIYQDKNHHLRKWYVLRAKINPKIEDLINDQFDFNISERLLNAPMIDLISQQNNEYRPSYLSKLGKEKLYKIPEIAENKLSIPLMHARIDYLWANQNLANRCNSCFIPQDSCLEDISDHYPIIATFKYS